jgi:hypothetical protein
VNIFALGCLILMGFETGESWRQAATSHLCGRRCGDYGAQAATSGNKRRPHKLIMLNCNSNSSTPLNCCWTTILSSMISMEPSIQLVGVKFEVMAHNNVGQ